MMAGYRRLAHAVVHGSPGPVDRAFAHMQSSGTMERNRAIARMVNEFRPIPQYWVGAPRWESAR